VDKIVILTRLTEADDRLIACLAMLFPECEIQIRSRQTKSLGDLPVAPEPVSTGKGEEGRSQSILT
jgi:hypothetical protein